MTLRRLSPHPGRIDPESRPRTPMLAEGIEPTWSLAGIGFTARAASLAVYASRVWACGRASTGSIRAAGYPCSHAHGVFPVEPTIRNFRRVGKGGCHPIAPGRIRTCITRCLPRQPLPERSGVLTVTPRGRSCRRAGTPCSGEVVLDMAHLPPAEPRGWCTA